MSSARSPRVFVSYRRNESRHVAGRLFEWLIARLGEGNVFMDVDSIKPGSDFVAAIEREIGQCDVLLVLIGNSWLTETDASGRPRIHNPDDIVAFEIRSAIEHKVLIIPILVDSATAPRAVDLPENLLPLARLNAVRLDYDTFRTDIQRLSAFIDAFSPRAGLANDHTRGGLGPNLGLVIDSPPPSRLVSAPTVPANVTNRVFVRLDSEYFVQSSFSWAPSEIKAGSKARPTIRIAVLGASGAGKSTYLLAMYAEAIAGGRSYSFHVDDHAHHIQLTQDWKALIERGVPPLPTAATRHYKFTISYNLRALYDIEWVDYRGGVMTDRLGNPEVNALRAYLATAQAFHVLLDGELISKIRQDRR